MTVTEEDAAEADGGLRVGAQRPSRPGFSARAAEAACPARSAGVARPCPHRRKVTARRSHLGPAPGRARGNPVPAGPLLVVGDGRAPFSFNRWAALVHVIGCGTGDAGTTSSCHTRDGASRRSPGFGKCQGC